MSFHTTIARLREAVADRVQGETPDTCRVKREDLRIALHVIDRLDGDLRASSVQAGALMPAAPGSPASTVATEGEKDERQAFEAWMTSQGLGFLRDGDSYSLTYARRAWEAWQARARMAAPAAGDALPPLDDDLIEILGRPNFACVELATLLRAGGHSIKNKAEHEQAAVIHFLLGHYLKHGAAWHEHVGAAFEAIAQQSQRKDA